MELFFEYKRNKLLNFNDLVRRELTKCYEIEILKNNDVELTISLIGNFLEQMSEIDYNSYELYASTMLATTKMMIHNMLKNNLATEEDLMTYNTINYLIPDSYELLKYISQKAGVLEDLVKYSIMFEKLNLLGRKRVVQNNKEEQRELVMISRFHVLDDLKYGTPIITKDFIDYYIEMLDVVIKDPDQAVYEIENYMKSLYLNDKDTYKKNLKEMGRVFYKWAKYQNSINELEDNKIIENLSIIENKDEDELCEISITDNNMLFNIISGFCYHSINNGIKVKNNFISETFVDNYIKDKMPDSLKENKKKIKK